ncbi:MAG: hypothetical protein IPM54_06790 [Polyangiaceae bacterium]|nr:hypothetical protein [Polyangiaceae bacterium]
MTTHSSVGGELREGLTVERFAEVMAYRKFFPAWQSDEVLLRLGIRPTRWARAAAAWGEALDWAAKTEDPELFLRFAHAFGAMTRKLHERPTRIESLGEKLDPNVPDPDERPAPAPSGSVPTQYARSAVTIPAPPMPPGGAPAPAVPPLSPAARRRRAFETTADISEFVPRNPAPGVKPGGSGSKKGGA